MPDYISIEKLYYEVALIINEELYNENKITTSKHHKTEKELLKEKNK